MDTAFFDENLAKNSTDETVIAALVKYRNHLQFHNLDDDSNSISIEDLFDYVENEIDEDEDEDL